MIRFNNDYNHGAHPEILEALSAVNDNSFGGYGEDEWCKKAADLIRERVHCPDAPFTFSRVLRGKLYRDRQCAFFCSECDRCRYRTY